MTKGTKSNNHLAVVFNEILPTFEKAGVKYWVYGGVGLAGILGKFIRHNEDVDVYVLSGDFAKAGRILKKLCEKHGGLDGDDWILQYSMAKRTRRPKLDILIQGSGIFSLVPIYHTKKGIEFRVYDRFPLPDQALIRQQHTIDGFHFYSPPRDTILKLFRLLLEAYIISRNPEPIHKEWYKEWKCLIDARAVLPKKEVQAFITRYNAAVKAARFKVQQQQQESPNQSLISFSASSGLPEA